MTEENNVPDVRDVPIDELIEQYGQLRSQADSLPMDNPQCVETELVFMMAHKVFNGARIQ